MLLIKLTFHVENRLNNKHRSKDIGIGKNMEKSNSYILLIEMKNGVVTMENMEISQKKSTIGFQ